MWLRSKIYFWRGIDYRGEVYSGYILANSKVKVKEILAKSNCIAKSIVQRITFKTFFFGNYISVKELFGFTQQTTVTLLSGLSLAHSIKLAANYQSNNTFKYLLNNIINDIETGARFSVSIRKYPEIFDSFYCNMVEIAESSGSPNLVFTKLTKYLQQIEQFKQKSYKILLYPALLLSLTLIILICIILLVIPQFSVLYNNLGGDLPFATRLVISLSGFVNDNFLMIIFGQLFIVSIICFLYKRSIGFVKIIDRMLLSVPLFGKFFHKLILAKCINILYVTYTSGTPLIECLQYSKLISKNYLYVKFIESIIDNITNGESFKLALLSTNFFPSSVINILGLGDESSNLEEMLNYLVSYYDADIQRTFDTISALSEPIIMVILGLIIGFLVFTIYYPIINIGALV